MTLAIREAFDTFPQPNNLVSPCGITAATEFERIAKTWCLASESGLTQFVDTMGDSSCNEPEIVKARELLGTIDTEVSRAYGKEMLDLTRGFFPAPYIVSDSNAYIVESSTRSQIIGFLTELNRELSQAEPQQEELLI